MTNHPEYQALLRSVREQPDDDTARLVLADWLDEQGDQDAVAHATLIRSGIQQPELEYKVSRVSGSEQFSASSPVRPFSSLWAFSGWTEVVIRRGMVDSLSVLLQSFIGQAPMLFDLYPLTRIHITDRYPRWTRHRSGGRSRRATWWSQEEEQVTTVHILPKFLLEHPDRRRCNHPTDLKAMEVLSRRCVVWGREQAGLPPWSPGVLVERPEHGSV